MAGPKPSSYIPLVLGVLALAAWALVIWMAVIVSHTLIDTLMYIVKLAQMN